MVQLNLLCTTSACCSRLLKPARDFFCIAAIATSFLLMNLHLRILHHARRASKEARSDDEEDHAAASGLIEEVTYEEEQEEESLPHGRKPRPESKEEEDEDENQAPSSSSLVLPPQLIRKIEFNSSTESYDGMIHNGLMGNMDDDVHCSGNQEDRNEEIRPEVSRISCKNRLRQFRTWVKGKCNYKPRTGFACYTPTIDNATKFGGVKDGEEKEEHVVQWPKMKAEDSLLLLLVMRDSTAQQAISEVCKKGLLDECCHRPESRKQQPVKSWSCKNFVRASKACMRATSTLDRVLWFVRDSLADFLTDFLTE